MTDVFDKHEGIRTMKGSIFSILQGHVQGLDGSDYYEEIDGELVSRRLAETLIEKGILKEKKKPEQAKTETKKKKDK